MVKIKINNDEIYYDGWLAQQFSYIRDNVIKKDWDWLTFVDGIEWGGKSTLAQQVAYLCDPTFNIDRICFSDKEFIKAVMAADRYQAIVFDEAYGAISSKESITKVCKTIENLLSQIRQKNLFVFIVAPTYFDISRNITLWRSKVLLHVTLGKGYQRGFFEAYTYTRKNKLYILGKKLYNYKAVKWSAQGRFTKKLVVNEEAYRKKKLDALTEFQEMREQPIHDAIKLRNAAFKYIHKMKRCTVKHLYKLVVEWGGNISLAHLYAILQEK